MYCSKMKTTAKQPSSSLLGARIRASQETAVQPLLKDLRSEPPPPPSTLALEIFPLVQPKSRFPLQVLETNWPHPKPPH